MTNGNNNSKTFYESLEAAFGSPEPNELPGLIHTSHLRGRVIRIDGEVARLEWENGVGVRSPEGYPKYIGRIRLESIGSADVGATFTKDIYDLGAKRLVILSRRKENEYSANDLPPQPLTFQAAISN